MFGGNSGVRGWRVVGLSSCGGDNRGWFGWLGVVISFTYGCGVCHGGFAALRLVFVGLGVVVL